MYIRRSIHYLTLHPKNRRSRLFFSSMAGLLYFGVCVISPKFFSLIEPDSVGYIEFHAIRTAGYPTFISILGALKIPLQHIGLVQASLFSLSISYLLYACCVAGVPLSVSIPLYVALISNIFFNAFHFTVLTESISFSLLLILLANFLLFAKDRNVINLLIGSMCIGLLIMIRPVAIALAPALLISGFLINGRMQNETERWLVVARTGVTVIVPIIICIAVEALIHSARHTERQSLLPIHLFGKAAIITTFDGFSSETAPRELRPFIKKMDVNLEVVRNYLATVQNPFLRIERYADYENFCYYVLLKKEQESLAGSLEMSVSDVQRRIGWWVISNNPIAYAKLSFIHYLSLFSVAAPTDFFTNMTPPPYIPPDTFGQSFRLPIIHFSFLGLACVFIAISFWYFLRLAYALCRPSAAGWSYFDKVAVNLLLWVHGLHVLTALTSLGSPRYLMFSYPLIVLALLMFAYAIVDRQTKKQSFLS